MTRWGAFKNIILVGIAMTLCLTLRAQSIDDAANDLLQDNSQALSTLAAGRGRRRGVFRNFQRGFRRRRSGRDEDVTFDLSSIAVADVPGMERDEVARRTMNFLLNFTSDLPRTVKVSKSRIQSGRVRLTGRNVDEALDMDLFRELERREVVKNPYACGRNRGGFENNFRLDVVVDQIVKSPDAYRLMSHFPNTWQELARDLGTSDNPPGRLNGRRDKIVVENGVITAGGGPRVLELERRSGFRNRFVRRSYDFSVVNQGGDQERFSNPKERPNDLEAQAGEMYFDLDNGFQGYFISNAQGVFQRSAPGDIVKLDEKNQQLANTFDGKNQVGLHHSSAISPPWDCMRCHDNGSQSNEPKFDITKYLATSARSGLISARTLQVAQDIYASGKSFTNAMKRADSPFQAAKKRAEADIKGFNGKDVAPLPLMAEAYEKDLDLPQLAREFKVSEDEIKTAITSNRDFRAALGLEGKVDGGSATITRKAMETGFCVAKAALRDERSDDDSGERRSRRSNRNTRSTASIEDESVSHLVPTK